ncbi:MAG: hypothetical protein E7608_02220 [Ruminococcaceae bacterium]|nr:hypothetical protein [Oscillospiraceae bacterium]
MKNINVDLSVKTGKIKPMNAVNNGPLGNSERGTTNFPDYAALEIPYARNHDASFYSGYGGEHTVDVHRIFKNFDADENDPASYIFEPTDMCVKNTLDAGTKVFYRLGASIEHGYKYGTYPPRDFAKWARICEHIIRHYNEGWANGFHYGIEYWEIWNEPDCRNNDGSNPCWQGTDEQFIDLYEVASKHLKKCFPRLKIGGPAFTAPKHAPFQLAFLKAVKEREMPFDFYSFHRYMKRPEQVFEAVELAKSSLNMFGIKKPELILNEWNYIKGWMTDEWRYSLRMEKSLKGASFIAGVMCTGQASDVDMLMYYDARPCGMCGLFDTDSLDRLKGYYTFLQFRELARLGNCVKTDAQNGDIYTCAATNGNDGAVFLTRYDDVDEADDEEVTINIDGVCAENGVNVEHYLLDGEHDSELVREERFYSQSFSLRLNMKMFDTYLLKIKMI